MGHGILREMQIEAHADESTVTFRMKPLELAICCFDEMTMDLRWADTIC